MANSESWTKEKAAEYYREHRDEIKIRRRRERMGKNRKDREKRVKVK